MTGPLWRVFPWDENAEPGARFSPSFLPEQSGRGRFDLPRRVGASSWYFAESPEHAVAEKIQDLRNRVLYDDFLFEYGHRLAICEVDIEGELPLADLCDPGELSDRGIAPDRLAFRDRSVTQPIAEQLHDDAGLAGFRWWSSLFGDWHTAVFFSDRVPDHTLDFSAPTPLDRDAAPLVRAARALGIEVEGSRLSRER